MLRTVANQKCQERSPHGFRGRAQLSSSKLARPQSASYASRCGDSARATDGARRTACFQAQAPAGTLTALRVCVQIPDDILNNESLKAAMKVLPANYSFEVRLACRTMQGLCIRSYAHVARQAARLSTRSSICTGYMAEQRAARRSVCFELMWQQGHAPACTCKCPRCQCRS